VITGFFHELWKGTSEEGRVLMTDRRGKTCKKGNIPGNIGMLESVRRFQVHRGRGTEAQTVKEKKECGLVTGFPVSACGKKKR